MKRKIIRYACITLMIAIIIFAIFILQPEGQQTEATQQTQIQTTKLKTQTEEIKLGIAEYDTLNPIISNNKNIQEIQKLIYEPLFDLTSEYELKNVIASEWAKQTNTVYIIKIKNDLKWSDGKEITTNDIKYTINCIQDNPTSIYFAQIEDVKDINVIDSYTMRITLKQEVPFFEYNLIFPIIQENSFAETTIPIGSGMYKILENDDSKIVLDRNTNWSNENNVDFTIKTVTIKKYSSLSELYNDFRNGNIDVINTDNAEAEKNMGKIGYTKKQMQGREHTFLALNTQNDILQDEVVRKAISYAINKEDIVTEICNNETIVSNFPMEYAVWIYPEQEASNYVSQDVNQFFNSNGWNLNNNYWQKYENKKNKKTILDLSVKSSDTQKMQVAENIKEQLESQGILINISYESDYEYMNNLENKNYDIALCSVCLSSNPNMELFFGENNLADYQNDEINELLKKVKNTTDKNIFKKEYEKMREIYNTDVPYISLYSNKHIVAYNLDVSGKFDANWFYSFFNIETWKIEK